MRQVNKIGLHADTVKPNKLTFTCDSADINAVSQWTFTAEGSVCVDALTVNAWVVEAFIDIWN